MAWGKTYSNYYNLLWQIHCPHKPCISLSNYEIDKRYSLEIRREINLLDKIMFSVNIQDLFSRYSMNGSMALQPYMTDTSPWHCSLTWWRLHHSIASLYDGHLTKTLHPCITDPSSWHCILMWWTLHHGHCILTWWTLRHGHCILHDGHLTMALHPYVTNPSPMTLFPLSFTPLFAISALLY